MKANNIHVRMSIVWILALITLVWITQDPANAQSTSGSIYGK